MDRALAIDPNDFDAVLNRGNVEFILKEWDKGHRDLDRAATLEPESAEVHQALGTMWFYQGNLDSALNEYLHALRLAPRSSSVHSELGLLYRKLGREGDALAQLRRALSWIRIMGKRRRAYAMQFLIPSFPAEVQDQRPSDKARRFQSRPLAREWFIATC